MRTSIAFLTGAFLYVSFLFSVPSVASAADESVTVTSRFYAAPGREAEVEARFLKFVEYVRKAEPNITYRLYRSKKDPSVFLFYEVYPSQAASDEHSKVTLPAFRKEYGPPAEGLFARPAETETFRALSG
jgi:quinol monooxygenase YgiN